MGLPMNNLHNPTVVPSGPSTNLGVANEAPQEEMPLKDLIAEKTRVDEELKALGSVLDSVRLIYNIVEYSFSGPEAEQALIDTA